MTVTLSLGSLVALVTMVAMFAACGGLIIGCITAITGRADERMAAAQERHEAEMRGYGLEPWRAGPGGRVEAVEMTDSGLSARVRVADTPAGDRLWGLVRDRG